MHVDGDKKLKTLMFVCYPESCNIKDVVEKIHKLGGHEYAYILHDKDVDSNGDLKKPHYHVLCWFPSYVHIDAFVKVTGRNVEAFTSIRSRDRSIQYLVHRNDPDKYQYDISDIHSEGLCLDNYFYDGFAVALGNRKERECGELFSTLLDFCDSHPSFNALCKFVSANPAYYSVFVKNSGTFKTYIENLNPFN